LKNESAQAGAGAHSGLTHHRGELQQFSAGARASTNILSLEERRFERGFAVAIASCHKPTNNRVQKKKKPTNNKCARSKEKCDRWFSGFFFFIFKKNIKISK